MMVKLGDKKWEEFFIQKLFTTIQRGKRLTKSNQKQGKKPYISSTSSNNGVDNFIANSQATRLFGNCISIANSGSVGSTFYHPYQFIASDHVTHLKNDKYNSYIYFFLSTQLKTIAQKYNFNREINDTRISREKILLPTTQNSHPDWRFMENYSKNILEKKRRKYKEYILSVLNTLRYHPVESLSDKNWKEFFIQDIFKIIIGKNIDGNKINKDSGTFPYITRKEHNNGNDGFITENLSFLYTDIPVITIGNETAKPFVQIYPFFTGTKVNIMKPRSMLSKEALFFVCQSIMQQKNKFSYSYTINSTRLKKQKILLPATKSGQPDYDYMEQYIQNIIYKKIQQYLAYCQKT